MITCAKIHPLAAFDHPDNHKSLNFLYLRNRQKPPEEAFLSADQLWIEGNRGHSCVLSAMQTSSAGGIARE
jgi:hypothetical protein